MPEFTDYTMMIKKICWKKSQQHGIEMEELEGQAGLIYVEALSKFDPTKGMKFGTFYYMLLERQLVGWQRSHSSFSINIMNNDNERTRMTKGRYANNGGYREKRDRGICVVFDQENEEGSFAPPHVIAEFRDSLKTLSMDSKDIVQMIFEAPEDIVDGAIGRSKFMAGNVRKKLKAEGWSDWKIWSCFTEIRSIL